MAIFLQKNNKTGITYVYQSSSFWDIEKQQSRSKRKSLGRLDEELFGEVYPNQKFSELTREEKLMLVIPQTEKAKSKSTDTENPAEIPYHALCRKIKAKKDERLVLELQMKKINEKLKPLKAEIMELEKLAEQRYQEDARLYISARYKHGMKDSQPINLIKEFDNRRHKSINNL